MKLAHWTGLIEQTDTSMDELQERAASGDGPLLRLLFIPDDALLGNVTGDDWNDAPAHCNADGPYEWPEGGVWVQLQLGKPLTAEQRVTLGISDAL